MNEISLSTIIGFLKKAWYLYNTRRNTFLTLGGIVFVVSMLQVVAVKMQSMLLFGMSVLATVIVSYIIYLAMIRVAADPARITAGEALTRVEHIIIPAALVSVTMLLIALGGTLLLVVPGIIVSILMIFSVFAVVVDHHQHIDAVVSSWHLVKKRFFSIFVSLLTASIVIGLGLIAIFIVFWTLGIGETPFETIARVKQGNYQISLSQVLLEQALTNFLILPFTISFIAVLYEHAKKQTPHEPSHHEVVTVKKYLKILSVLGVVFLVAGMFISSLRLTQILPELVWLTHAPAAVFTSF
jgi:hypothetical protein